MKTLNELQPLIIEWAKDKDFSEKIPKPVDDMIDSYFIMKTLDRE